MRTRLWLIILVLLGVVQTPSTQQPMPTATYVEVWFPADDLAARVVYQAQRRALEPPFRSRPRSRSCPWGRRGSKKRRWWYRPGSIAFEKELEAEAEQPCEPHPSSVLDPERWGLTPELSRSLPDRLYHFWMRYAETFMTQTRDTSIYAYHYLRGLLRLDTQRNYATIGRATGIPAENIQHFMSNSPWVAQRSMEQVREEIKATPGLERGGVLLLDESADKAGERKAGAGRQHNGRLGKLEMSQVGVFLAYANLTHPERPLWTWVDGELFLQALWFTPAMAERRQQVGIPPEQTFETKIEKGWKMIQRVLTQGLPFEAVACDDFYGRSTAFRDQLDGAGLTYMADVPRKTQVYLEKPLLGVPERKPGSRGPTPTRIQVLNGVKPFAVHQVARHTDTTWTRIRVRPIERGELNDPFAVRRVWTLREGETEPVEEWLVIRCEAQNRYNYSLSNAPVDATIQDLAWLKCQRYFVERANQDAKSEAGWDELRARKYRGWMHHLALVILATWFVAQTKWEWSQTIVRDPDLVQRLAVEVLPALSMANIRLLLRAAMPLPQPTPEQTIVLITQHLINRTRSRASRLRRSTPVLRSTAHAPP